MEKNLVLPSFSPHTLVFFLCIFSRVKTRSDPTSHVLGLPLAAARFQGCYEEPTGAAEPDPALEDHGVNRSSCRGNRVQHGEGWRSSCPADPA